MKILDIANEYEVSFNKRYQLSRLPTADEHLLNPSMVMTLVFAASLTRPISPRELLRPGLAGTNSHHTLTNLCKRGFMQRVHDRRRGPDRRLSLYSLTANGRAIIAAIQTEWQQAQMPAQVATKEAAHA